MISQCLPSAIPSCKVNIEAMGSHALCCAHGPGLVSRHERVKHALAKCVEEAMGHAPLMEQIVPEWNDGQREARLDISFATPAGQTRHVDVTCGHVLARGSGARAAEQKDGGLAPSLERSKGRDTLTRA